VGCGATKLANSAKAANIVPLAKLLSGCILCDLVVEVGGNLASSRVPGAGPCLKSLWDVRAKARRVSVAFRGIAFLATKCLLLTASAFKRCFGGAKGVLSRQKSAET
jgi:hypothetical protein